jgi:hypothetical protein
MLKCIVQSKVERTKSSVIETQVAAKQRMLWSVKSSKSYLPLWNLIQTHTNVIRLCYRDIGLVIDIGHASRTSDMYRSRPLANVKTCRLNIDIW